LNSHNHTSFGLNDCFEDRTRRSDFLKACELRGTRISFYGNPAAVEEIRNSEVRSHVAESKINHPELPSLSVDLVTHTIRHKALSRQHKSAHFHSRFLAKFIVFIDTSQFSPVNTSGQSGLLQYCGSRLPSGLGDDFSETIVHLLNIE